MKYNKVNKYSINRFDKSFEKNKYLYQKTNINNNILSINKKNNNNYTTFQNLNRKKDKKINEINYIDNNKFNLLHIQKNQTNNKTSKNKYLKFRNSQIKRDCLTPDKNINNLKFGLTTHKKENKNNILLLKSNMQRNQSFIEYHFKNSSKKFLTRSKSKNSTNTSNLSNDRQKAFTPDKINKTRNINISKSQINNKNEENKKIKNKNNYSGQNQLFMNFTKSFKNQNNFNMSNIDFNNYSLLNNSSINKKRSLISDKRKTPDKYNNNKYNTKLFKGSNLPMLTKISNDSLSLSKSFCSNKNTYKFENQRNNDYLLSNLKLKKAQKEFNKIYTHNYYSKGVSRSKSTDSNYKKKLFNNNAFKNDNSYIKQNSKNKNINNNFISNISYENIYNNNHKNHNILNNYQNNFYNALNNTEITGNYNINQKNKKLKNDKSNGKNNLVIKNTFLEMAQQKINNKNALNVKNYKYNGINNFITKSSTNTNDEINSTNSILSKNNQILDSIEEIHFNFVNVVQSSRNLMKYQENTEGEKIINNNPNSTVIILEEKDIE